MPQLTLPEVKLPNVKLPEGLRDMNREDIANAAKDVRMPKIEMPDIDLSKIELPKMDLSKVELPKQITDRMPNRKRSNPILPIAGLLAVGAMIAAAWYLITSPMTGPKIRSAVHDLKARMNGESSDLVRYDDDHDLGSLLGDSDANGSTAADAYASSNTTTDLGGVPVGPGELSESIRSN
jgi:hypothetical protein